MPVYTDEGRMQHDGFATPDILGIGDSWFWWHINNLLIPISQLWNQPQVILTHGGAGANAVELAKGGNLAAYRRVLRGSGNLKAVLVSGGGNDFAGLDDMFRILVKAGGSQAVTGADCFIKKELDALMFTEVLGAYRTLARELKRWRPEAVMFVHNYDYALPSGVGHLGFGHWLKDPMDAVNIPAAVQQLAVNHLIDTFTDVLAQVYLEFPEHVEIVDTRNALVATDWANELHPESSGFNKLVSQRWAPALLARFP
jgi:hypothetical protein